MSAPVTRRPLTAAEVYAMTPWFAPQADDAESDMVVCSHCGGSGEGFGGEHSRCRTCRGRGEVAAQQVSL